MDDKDLKRLKEIEIESLKVFIQICEKYKLKYFMLGGSCLGVVRHNGFIPWDDDIDVGMPRKDYNKFLAIAQNELPQNLFLQTTITDPEYLMCFAKLRNSDTTFMEISSKEFNINHGVYIDIFPLDGITDDESERKSHLFKLRVCHKAKSRYWHKKDRTVTLKSKVYDIILKMYFRNIGNIIKAEEKLMLKYDYDKCNSVFNYCGAWGEKEIAPKEWFGEGKNAEFEGLTVIIPQNSDAYLTKMYGDYMTLPPVEKRVGHHYCEIIDLEKSYKNFISQGK